MNGREAKENIRKEGQELSGKNEYHPERKEGELSLALPQKRKIGRNGSIGGG